MVRAATQYHFTYPGGSVHYDSRMSPTEILDAIEKELSITCPSKTGIVARLVRVKDGVLMVQWQGYVAKSDSALHPPQRNWFRREAEGAFGNPHSSANIILRSCPA